MKRHTLAAERTARVEQDRELHARVERLWSSVNYNHDQFVEARQNVIRDRSFIGRFKWLFTGK